MIFFINKGGICLGFFQGPYLPTLFNIASDFTVSEDAGIEPRAVATIALAVRNNH